VGKKLHEALNDLYFPYNIVQVIKSSRIRWVGQPEGKRPLGCRWEDNIKMDLQAVGCEGMDWIKLTQDRDRQQALLNVVMNLQDPQNVGNFLTS